MMKASTAAVILMMSMIAACSQRPAAPVVSDNPGVTSTPSTSGPRAVFSDGTVIHLELATDDDTRAQGLMFRDRVREGTGMLFLFPASGKFPFWMKNTLVPLDMIWIDEAQKITEIASDVPPCKADPCASYGGTATSRYVLEVAAGVAKRHGLAAGQAISLSGLEGVAVR